jgi:hypothetical protein
MTKEITFSALAGALVATLGMGASPVAQAENSLDEGRFMVAGAGGKFRSGKRF